MKFSFNKIARTEAIDALKKLGTMGSPATMILSLFFDKLGDKVAVVVASLVAFIVTRMAVVFIAGLDDAKPKKPVTRKKAISKRTTRTPPTPKDTS